MCRQKGNLLKKFDVFGAEVGLTFNGDTNYGTKVGGFLTIVIMILLGGSFMSNVITVFTNPKFNDRVVTTYN